MKSVGAFTLLSAARTGRGRRLLAWDKSQNADHPHSITLLHH
jgi:hypothetical protein